MTRKPSRILMLKAHSAGIGDLLRSSAAWRVLKNAYPGAQLHLVLFTREPGYPSEALMRDHHLLSSFSVVDKRTGNIGSYARFWKETVRVASVVKPDMVIDFEPNGLRTTFAVMWIGLRHGARTVGINAVQGRGIFYGRASVSPRKYARLRGLPYPLEYVERDFVALTALGLERNGCPIELHETEAGREARQMLLREVGVDNTRPLLGLNIGCGTPDAVRKRPDLGLLSELAAGLQRDRGMRLVLTGAPFERDINEKFRALHKERSHEPIIDMTGKTSISGLTGLLSAFSLFISSDSGPYHIGVALQTPTLAVFRWENRAHYHSHPWVRCRVANGHAHAALLRADAEELLAWKRTRDSGEPRSAVGLTVK